MPESKESKRQIEKSKNNGRDSEDKHLSHYFLVDLLLQCQELDLLKF